MKSIYHHVAAGLVFAIPYTVIGFWLTTDYWFILKCALIFTFFSAAADCDKAFNSHRHIIFHSLLVPIFFVLCWPDMFPILAAWGLHLFLDIFQSPGKHPVGLFNLIIWKGKRLSGKKTKAILSISGILGVIMSFVLLVI